MTIEVVPQLDYAGWSATDQVMVDALVDEWSESCKMPLPFTMSGGDRTKGSGHLVVVRKSWAHVLILTRSTQDLQGRSGVNIWVLRPYGNDRTVVRMGANAIPPPFGDAKDVHDR